jgi:16S rRNA (guanine1516-N2)-methyltransferase
LQDVDVIYLDPMFPPRRKSAAVRKEMALFHSLLARTLDPQDADALLLWALRQDTARVVVKRPAKAPCLAAKEPSHTISGKAVRYDVYVHRKLPT